MCLALALTPTAWSQVKLPSLGESASDEVTVSAEKRIGDQIMREIRRDPDYLDDPVLLEYLQSIWLPLVDAARQLGDIAPDINAAFAWEAFLVRDRSVNAFRVGFAVLREAGFAPSGMARMFEKLDYANRLNDSGAYPYLRSHPLTTERVAEAQSRLGTGAVATAKVRPEHALMQARARVLMDPTVQARRRQQGLDKALANSAEDGLAALYASVLASLLLRDFARAGEAFASGERLVAGGAIDGRSARQCALLGVELAVAQGDAAVADKRLAALPADTSRPRMLLEAQVVLMQSDAARLKRQCEVLQSWTSGHRGDALAWNELSSCADRQGQALRAVRAQAESRAALGDWTGAIDRLRAGQRLARSGATQDFIESSVIDSRLRDLEGQRRQLLDELRAKGPQREPSQ
ncbi:MAG TPA: hypothetical protein VGJ35_06800 [Burkholderiaceae bacterium]